MSDTTEYKMYQSRNRDRLIIAGGGGALLVAATLVLFLYDGDSGHGTWFVALLVSALLAVSATAAVFSALKLGNPEEAFGLPSGSIRALLAIGLMTLLVVFGLRTIQGDRDAEARLSPKPLATVEVAADQSLADRIKAYQAQGLVVVPQPAAAAVEGAPAPPAKLDLYTQEKVQGPNDADISKQLMTAVITLLTTVIGFYFGSRSTTDGVKVAEAAVSATSAPNDLVQARKEVGDAFDAIEAKVTPAEQALQQIRARPPLENSEEEQQRVDLQNKAEVALQAVRTAREPIVKALGEADEAMAALARRPTADVAQVQVDAAGKAVSRAKGGLLAFTAAADTFVAAADTLVKATAEG